MKIIDYLAILTLFGEKEEGKFIALGHLLSKEQNSEYEIEALKKTKLEKTTEKLYTKVLKSKKYTDHEKVKIALLFSKCTQSNNKKLQKEYFNEAIKLIKQK